MFRSSIDTAFRSSTAHRLIGVGAALVLGACADQPTAPRPTLSPARASDARVDAPSLSEAAGPEFRRVFALREFNGTDRASKAAFSLATATNVKYHGGPVLQSGTNVVAVYWGMPAYSGRPSGSGSGTSDPTLIGAFLRGLGCSSHFKINTTYTNAAGARVLNVVNYTGFWSNDATPPASPTDADIVAMLQSGVTTGAIRYDASTVYAVLTGSGINLGGGFGTQYCAYHTHGTITDVDGVRKTILYAAMPYNAQYKSACTSGYAAANGTVDPAADYEVNTLAHEIEETTTDLMGNAWYDSFGYENADKCAWTWGTTHTAANGGVYNQTMSDPLTGSHNFLIQQNWVRVSPARCAQGY